MLPRRDREAEGWAGFYTGNYAFIVRPNTVVCAGLPFHVKSWTRYEHVPFSGACPQKSRMTTSRK
jgi:hypothetical protein